jgi:hypothetical protein
MVNIFILILLNFNSFFSDNSKYIWRRINSSRIT